MSNPANPRWTEWSTRLRAVAQNGLTFAHDAYAIFDRGKHPHEPPFAFHVYKIFIRCELFPKRFRQPFPRFGMIRDRLPSPAALPAPFEAKAR